jgi:hypothetical protein
LTLGATGSRALIRRRITAMTNEVISIEQSEEEVLNHEVSDEALEAAAEAMAMSYTYQTSAYNRCCR